MRKLVFTMLTVADVMTGSVTAVLPDTPLKHVARLLVSGGISGVPVVDADRHVLGVVSEADLLIKEQGAAALPHRRAARVRGESKATVAGMAKVGATTAGAAMSSPAITIGAEAGLPAAAAIMVERGVNRLPVVRDGVLIGIVTRADLIRAYVRTDAQIAETIREDVLLRHLLVNPVLFDITVSNGVVRMSGRAETRSIAEMIERLVAVVPGVIALEADLTWALDDDHIETLPRGLGSPSIR
jgi:CBS domain-containing protein